MLAGSKVTGEGEGLAVARGVQCRRGERAAKLLAVDRDGELRIGQVVVLGHLDHQRVGAAAGDYRRDRRAVGHAEALRPGAHERSALLGVRSVIGDVVHVEVAVGARRSAPGVVEEGHRDGVRARRPVTLESEVLAGSCGMRRGGVESAGELLAVHRHGERGVPIGVTRAIAIGVGIL